MLNNRVYDALKWIDMVCIPAITTFYVAMAPIWNWPYPDVCVLIGALLGISTA